MVIENKRSIKNKIILVQTTKLDTYSRLFNGVRKVDSKSGWDTNFSREISLFLPLSVPGVLKMTSLLNTKKNAHYLNFKLKCLSVVITTFR